MFNLGIERVVIWTLALALVVLVGSCVYRAGRKDQEHDVLKGNAIARDGADARDAGVQSCPPGMYDFSTGKCARP